MKHTKMKELPHEERPYERCVKSGPEYLSDAQLLAVILRTGSTQESVLELAGRILELGGPGEGILGLLHLSLPELMSVKGIGEGHPASVYRRAFQAHLETEGHKESGAF